MVNENYTVKQVMEISGACQSAVCRWKRQYLDEMGGKTLEGKKAMTADHQEIQDLRIILDRRWLKSINKADLS